MGLLEERQETLRKELLLVRENYQEAEQQRRLREHEHELERKRLTTRLETARNAASDAKRDISALRPQLGEARQSSARLRFCSLALRLLQHRRNVTEADGPGRLRQERLERLRAARLQQQRRMQQKRNEAEEGFTKRTEELEDLRRGGTRWREKVQDASTSGADALPIEQELRGLQAQLLEKRRSASTALGAVPAAAVQQKPEVKKQPLQVVRAELEALRRQVEAKAKAKVLPKPSGPHPPAAEVLLRPAQSTNTAPPPAKGQPPRPQPAVAKGPPAPPAAKKAGAPARQAPPPKCPPAGKAKAGVPGGVAASSAVALRSNGLVNLNWRATAAPKDSELSSSQDRMLGPISDLLSSGGERPRRRSSKADETVFNSCTTVSELLGKELHFWFHANKPAADGGALGFRGSANRAGSVGAQQPGAADGGAQACRRVTLLDEQTLRSLGVLLQRWRMRQNSRDGAHESDIATGIRQAVLRCTLTPEEILSLERVLSAHREAGKPVATFVEQKGVAALATCEPAAEHRVVHAISSISGIDKRLRCMAFEAAWKGGAKECLSDLQVVHDGLRVLTEKRNAVQSFFHTALRLGNTLNKAGGSPVTVRGFRLASLPKMMQLRCPSRPQLSFVHCVLALMDRAEVSVLSADMSKMSAARDRKSSGVLERCRELLQDWATTGQLCAELAPSGGTVKERCADIEDKFQELMRSFLQRSQKEACCIAQFCHDTFTTYRDLAIYLEDPNAVYPPPQRETDTAEDIFVVFHGLAEAVAKAAKEVTSMKLREEVGSQRAVLAQPPDGLNIADRIAKAKEDTLNNIPSPSRAKTRVSFSGSAAFTGDGTGGSAPAGPQGNSEARSSNAAMLQRLRKTTSKTNEDEDQQSDVSDWEESPQKDQKAGPVQLPLPLPTAAAVQQKQQPRQRQVVPSPSPPQRAVQRTSLIPSPSSVASPAPSPSTSSAAKIPPEELRFTPPLPCAPPPRSPKRRRLPVFSPMQRSTPPPAESSNAATFSPMQRSTSAKRGSVESVIELTPVGSPAASPFGSMPKASSFPQRSSTPSMSPSRSPSPSLGGSERALFASPSPSTGTEDSAAPTPREPPPQRSPRQVSKRQQPNLRKSLASVADRLESAALSKLLGDEDLSGSDFDDKESEVESDSERAITQDPQFTSGSDSEARPDKARRRCRTSRCAESAEFEKRVSVGGLQAALRAEVKRRSVSRGPSRTASIGGRPSVGPRRPSVREAFLDLTPVAEPGESPQGPLRSGGRDCESRAAGMTPRTLDMTR